MRLLGNYVVIYDKTYDETYEVIVRKLRASMEPFCDFNRVICRVTYACIWQISLKLRVILSDKYHWLNSMRSLGLRNPVLYIIHSVINSKCAV